MDCIILYVAFSHLRFLRVILKHNYTCFCELYVSILNSVTGQSHIITGTQVNTLLAGFSTRD